MMDLLLTVVLFTLGIVLIVKGGDAFVDAAAWMAEVSGIPKLIVGATVVSFATTLPELLVSSMAAFDGKVDMAIGNAVGSVTANLALIMGIALVCLPSAIRRRDYLLKAVLMLGASLYLVLAAACPSSRGSPCWSSSLSPCGTTSALRCAPCVRSRRRPDGAGTPGPWAMRCAAIFSNFFWGRPASSLGLSS